jgi:hypothetical protein
VLLHFGSLVTASTGPATHGKPPPWVTQVLHTYVYRDYSEFVYLKNAYHFYSPEPGPATQIWFCVYYRTMEKDPKTGDYVKNKETGEYDFGDTYWYKLPRRPDDIKDPLAVSYYRRLSLTMQLENYANVASVPPEAYYRREARASGKDEIPWYTDLPREQQWRPPSDAVRLFLIPSYVRHVVRREAPKHPDGAPVLSVKVYHVEHRVIPAGVVNLIGPYDPQSYWPYFVGEYDANGTPIHTDDPMLFWMCPIQYLPRNAGIDPWHNPLTHRKEFRLYDGVSIHARSDHSNGEWPNTDNSPSDHEAK